MISLKSMITADTLNTHKQTRGRLISITLIVFAVCIKVFTFRFGVLDELWEYDFCRAITMGYVPYKDFPFVSMPLFYYLFAIPLIISRTLFAFRVMTFVMLALTMVLIYDTMEKESSSGIALCITLFGVRFVEMSSYNMLMMLFALLCFRLLKKEDSNRTHFLLGLCAAAAVLTKQTSGGLLLIAVTGIIIYRKIRKHTGILRYIAGVSIPCLLFLIYLLATSSFTPFLEYCFFGLFGFAGNKAFYPDGTPILIVMITAGLICDIFFAVRLKDRDAVFHLLTGIAVLSNSIPIADAFHLVIAAVFFLIPAAKMIKRYASGLISFNLTFVIAPMILAIILILESDVFINPGFSDNSPELVLIPSSDQTDYYMPLYTRNKEYESEGKKVTVLSTSAVIFSILDGTFNPPFDVFNNGNFGRQDPVIYVERACSSSDTVILMPDDYITENRQNPGGIYEYITSHCTPVSSMGEWVWYTPNTAQED